MGGERPDEVTVLGNHPGGPDLILRARTHSKFA
jgi:hypothetical protein